MTTTEMADRVRTTLHYPSELHQALRDRAVAATTTLADLVESAVTAGLRDHDALAEESKRHNGVRTGIRSTFRMSSDVSLALKELAEQRSTSVHALVIAAIHRAYPDL